MRVEEKQHKPQKEQGIPYSYKKNILSTVLFDLFRIFFSGKFKPFLRSIIFFLYKFLVKNMTNSPGTIITVSQRVNLCFVEPPSKKALDTKKQNIGRKKRGGHALHSFFTKGEIKGIGSFVFWLSHLLEVVPSFF